MECFKKQYLNEQFHYTYPLKKMKKYFYLLLIIPAFIFSQSKPDYLVQFNTPFFAKKVNIDSLFNHNVFKSLNKETSPIKLNDFIAFLDKTRPIIIHGNFTDSIPYYQVSFPINNQKALKNFIQNKIKEDSRMETDSIPETIKSHEKYEVYSSKNNDYSLAWNQDSFIVYGLLESKKTPDYTTIDTTGVEGPGMVEEIEEAPEEVVVVEGTKTDTLQTEEEEEEGFDEAYYKELAEKYAIEQQQTRKEKQAKQEEQIKKLFENGFIMPSSTEINTTADISAWINYQSIYGKLNNYNYFFSPFSPRQEMLDNPNSIKGMSVDFYFENDKARVEQTIEYSEPLAKIMDKVIARKPNKDIYNYFPKEAPLAFMTYHFSTEEMIKNYPQITEQLWSSLPLEKQDITIITDLFTTIIDEKATASLFDGDISMFFHNLESYEDTFTDITYDENYEEVEEEKTITKKRPIFSLIMTSTHATMAERLLDLGVRKKLFTKEKEYYSMQETKEFGKLLFFKEGSVFVITNGLNYLNKGTKSDFSKAVKKELKQNQLLGNFDFQGFMTSFMNNQDLGKDTEKMLKISNQFKNIQMKSSNKMTENKMTFEMEMNSNYADKNIIIQTFDLIDFLK